MKLAQQCGKWGELTKCCVVLTPWTLSRFQWSATGRYNLGKSSFFDCILWCGIFMQKARCDSSHQKSRALNLWVFAYLSGIMIFRARAILAKQQPQIHIFTHFHQRSISGFQSLVHLPPVGSNLWEPLGLEIRGPHGCCCWQACLCGGWPQARPWINSWYPVVFSLMPNGGELATSMLENFTAS